MRFQPTIKTDAPETVRAQPGQWIDYEGCRGRYLGHRNGNAWIAWGRSATHRFSRFARAYHAVAA